jgi:peroxiredoxin
MNMRRYFIYLLLIFMPTVQAAQTLSIVPNLPLAIDFKLKDINGKTHNLSDYRGKPVIVNFWATWCPPCRKEMPSMQRAWQKIEKEGIVMLAINIGQTEASIAPFVFEYALSFPILLDSNSSVIKAWRVRGLPSTFVIDTKGRIAYQAVGEREWDDPALLEKVYALKIPQDKKSSHFISTKDHQ